MREHRWIPPVALAIVFSMLWGATGGTPLSSLFGILAGLMVIATVAVVVMNRKGKYDLGALREFHEQELIHELEPEDPGDIDSLLCPYCGTAYSMRFPVCPNCAKPRG